jgi:hypothetical protein
MDTTTDTIVNQQASWFTFVACNADLFSAPSVLHCVYWGDGVEGLVDILPEQFTLGTVSHSPAE